MYTHPKGVHLNPNGIRTYLQSISNLEGALLIGELPITRIGTPESWYASDYFFMELNGNWDVDGNNFVSCSNYQPPTIFIGRVIIGEDTGHVLGAEKPSILEFYNQYLAKLIGYRLNSSHISLAYNGQTYNRFSDSSRNNFKAVLVNNWGGDTQIITEWLTHLYPVEDISVYEDVNRDEYWDILDNNPYDFIAFRSHSFPMGHTLEDATIWNAHEYLLVESNVNFFELTACDVGSLVWDSPLDPYDPASPKQLKLVSDVLVWNILFAEKGGVIVLAPSISGAMNHTSVFYDYLHDGGTFGRAFRLWAEYIHSFGARPEGWAFILFFGDPFIRFDIPNCQCVAYTSLVSSTFENKLKSLRIWRDEIFKKKPIGKSFVITYYGISPLFAKFIIKSKPIKSLSRWILIRILNILNHTKWNKIVDYNLKITAPKSPKKLSLSIPECKVCKESSNSP